MITVIISINGLPIASVNAVNQMEQNGKGETRYITTEGNEVWHNPDNGAVELAKKLLDLIRNDL